MKDTELLASDPLVGDTSVYVYSDGRNVAPIICTMVRVWRHIKIRTYHSRHSKALILRAYLPFFQLQLPEQFSTGGGSRALRIIMGEEYYSKYEKRRITLLKPHPKNCFVFCVLE